MPLRFYMDVHVPLAVTERLRRMGVDVLTSQEDGTAEMGDDLLLDRATTLGRLLFTQDQDFLRIASERQEAGLSFVGILFAHQRGVSLGQLVEDLELIASCGEPAEFGDRLVYLPL
jgi:hypothetical protein